MTGDRDTATRPERLRAVFAGAGFAILAWLAAAAHGQQQAEPIRARLEARGVAVTAEGLRDFLHRATAEGVDDGVAYRLIADLGSSDYGQRNAAQRQLILLPQLPVDRLRELIAAGSPEASYRAQVVLKNWLPERQAAVLDAVSLIGLDHAEGCLPALFRVAEAFAEQPRLLRAVELAVADCARPTDAELLRGRLASGEPSQARAAMAGIAKIADAGWKDELIGWAGDTQFDETTRLGAAVAAIDLQDHRALPLLVQLLAAERRSVGSQANLVLRKVTGQSFPFSAASPEKLSETQARWREWLAENAAALTWSGPIAAIRMGKSRLGGHLLLATGYRNQVIEFDEDGNEVWRVTAGGCWSAEKMDNGNVLVACYQENKVKQFAPSKQVVWEYEVGGVLSARPVDSGNILVASHSLNRVLEISPEKAVVWEFTAPTQCHDALRLDDGNTLVCSNDEVLEVDPQGEIVWRFSVDEAYGIDLASNGNILVAQLSGSVIEIQREAKAIVWRYPFTTPADVFRTDDGHTLITGGQSAIELDEQQNIVWSREDLQFGSARK